MPVAICSRHHQTGQNVNLRLAGLESGWDCTVVALVEDTLSAEVGGSLGDGVDDMSESQNNSGEFARAIPSLSDTGSGISNLSSFGRDCCDGGPSRPPS